MARVPKYRAIRACYHRSYYYNAGDPYLPTEDELKADKVPEHFVKEQDYSEELVELAEIEDRNRTVFVKPTKADEVTAPNAVQQ